VSEIRQVSNDGYLYWNVYIGVLETLCGDLVIYIPRAGTSTEVLPALLDVLNWRNFMLERIFPLFIDLINCDDKLFSSLEGVNSRK